MAFGSANIYSPDTVRRFRERYRKFDKRARRAVELVSGDLRSLSEWLSREQQVYWRGMVRRRHDEMKQAWRDYVNARHRPRSMGRGSSVDERKAYERSKMMKAQAERKLAVVEHWIRVLEGEAEKLMPGVRRLDSMLEELSPKAVARLDHMLDRLSEYMGPTKSRVKEGDDAANQSGGADADGGAG